jgi:hypothetical protein
MKYVILLFSLLSLASCGTIKKTFTKDKSSVDSTSLVKSDSVRVIKSDSVSTTVSNDSGSVISVEEKDVVTTVEERKDTAGNVTTVTRIVDKGRKITKATWVSKDSTTGGKSASDSSNVKKSNETGVKKTIIVTTRTVKKAGLIETLISFWWLWLILAVVGYLVIRYRKMFPTWIGVIRKVTGI